MPLTMSPPPKNDHTTAGDNSVDTLKLNDSGVLTQDSARQASLTLCRWALAILIERRKARQDT